MVNSMVTNIMIPLLVSIIQFRTAATYASNLIFCMSIVFVIKWTETELISDYGP